MGIAVQLNKMTMASSVHYLSPFLIFLVTVFSLLSSFSFCFNPEEDASTVATWYGDPTGAGSGGGACGYGVPVLQGAPFSKFITAGGPSLFNSGKGCGQCYQVSCSSNPACSGKPVTVTLADFCPPPCGGLQFDLSGTAFGAMALPGKEDQLRKVGRLNIQYQRATCQYGNVKLTFEVDPHSNPNYFATVIVYGDGEGDLSKVELQNGGSRSPFLPMQRSFGASWAINISPNMKGPYSIRLTTPSGKTLVAYNVIPLGWQPGQTYKSTVNF